MTYRFKGHYYGDPDNYRTKEEIKQWQTKDPIDRLRKHLLESGLCAEDEITAMNEEIERRAEVDRDWALQQPTASLDYALSNVLVPVNGRNFGLSEQLSARAEAKRVGAGRHQKSLGTQRMLTYAEAIREALDEEMARDPRVYLMGEDIGVWGNLFSCTKGLLEKYGRDRVMDTPISEARIHGLRRGERRGRASAGRGNHVHRFYLDRHGPDRQPCRPMASAFRRQDQGPAGGPHSRGRGCRNSSQHSQSLENWFVNVPGLVVAMPATPYDAKGLLKAAIRNDNPVIVIEHKAVYRNKGHVPADDYLIPLGVAEVKRKGKDLTIVATSWMVLHAPSAAEELAKEGIYCEVVDPRTLYPLDEEAVAASVRKTGHCLVVTEVAGGGRLQRRDCRGCDGGAASMP